MKEQGGKTKGYPSLSLRLWVYNERPSVRPSDNSTIFLRVVSSHSTCVHTEGGPSGTTIYKYMITSLCLSAGRP